MISGSLLQSLIPAFSQLQSKDRRGQLEALFSLGIRSSLLWIVPAIVLMTIFAEPIITLWAGRDFGSHSVLPLHILLIGITVNTFNYIPSSILLAAGRADLISKLYWVELFPYLLLVYFLSLWYGAIGAAAAWTARVSADVAAHFIMLNRYNALRVPERAIKWFLLAIALILAAILMAYYYRNSFSPALMIIIGLFLAVYQFAAMKSLVHKDEVRWLVAKFRSRFGFINTNENIGSNPYI
jgi:O-antigen/teichoic acid export membrane protein